MLELLEIFANNILPILLIAGLGYLVGGRFLKLEPRPIGQLIFYVLSPSLVFYSLLTSEVDGGEFIHIALTMMAFQGMMAIIALVVTRLMGATQVERANTMISAFCLNAGNYGLSLVAFAFDNEVFSRAIVAFVANVIINYTLGVYVASSGKKSPVGAFINVLKTPAVYAVIAAFAIRSFELQMPIFFARTAEMLAGAAIPLMLLLLGLQLGQSARIRNMRLVVTGVGLKLFAAPFVAAGLAALSGLTGPAAVGLIVQASMPTAVLTIIFATEFDLDRELALNFIMATTLLSPITLSLLIYFLG